MPVTVFCSLKTETLTTVGLVSFREHFQTKLLTLKAGHILQCTFQMEQRQMIEKERPLKGRSKGYMEQWTEEPFPRSPSEPNQEGFLIARRLESAVILGLIWISYLPFLNGSALDTLPLFYHSVYLLQGKDHLFLSRSEDQKEPYPDHPAPPWHHRLGLWCPDWIWLLDCLIRDKPGVLNIDTISGILSATQQMFLTLTTNYTRGLK